MGNTLTACTGGSSLRSDSCCSYDWLGRGSSDVDASSEYLFYRMSDTRPAEPRARIEGSHASGASRRSRSPCAFRPSGGSDPLQRATAHGRTDSSGAAPRMRSWSDYYLDHPRETAGEVSAPAAADPRVGPHAIFFAVADGRQTPDHTGPGYRAYFLQGDSHHGNWLVVPDEDAAFGAVPRSSRDLCQLMLRLDGQGRRDGLHRLGQYDRAGDRPFPTAPLLAISDIRQLVAEVRRYLNEHKCIVLQHEDQSIMLSLSGAGRAIAPGGLTILDPSTMCAFATYPQDLGIAIEQLCRPTGDRQVGAGQAPKDYFVSYLPPDAGKTSAVGVAHAADVARVG